MSLPQSLAMSRARSHWEAVQAAEGITGCRASREHLAMTTFLDGFRAGCTAVKGGELVAENDALHEDFLDLEIGQKDVVALRQLLSDVLLASIAHKVGCECALCVAIRAYDEAMRSARQLSKGT